eukprot:273636-Chlamydomonas_euryale.AAC.3
MLKDICLVTLLLPAGLPCQRRCGPPTRRAGGFAGGGSNVANSRLACGAPQPHCKREPLLHLGSAVRNLPCSREKEPP